MSAHAYLSQPSLIDGDISEADAVKNSRRGGT